MVSSFSNGNDRVAGSATTGPVYTTSNGAPVANPLPSQQVGRKGPLLLQDFHLIDLLAHFDRERIPERVVHAKGAGAHGYFEVTHDVTELTCAKFLNTVGKHTPVLARFSPVSGERGSSDTARDPRGFAWKFYTEEGNWDMVGNNTPIFFLRDPAKFPIFIHTQKRSPQTNLRDANMFWDYLSNNQESIHQVMHLFSDRGTPYGYRHMHGYSSHTFKWVKEDGSFVYVQLHYHTDQGVKNLTNEEALELSGKNPDFATQDLFDAIERGDNPSWTAYVQVMTPEQAEKFRFNIFDLTKVWPQKEFPLRPYGKLVLNRNVQNYFAEIEQVAFAPSHVVPGIEPSVDPVLQSRLFSYPDTHRHRLGTNYQQIPVNQTVVPVFNYQRDGPMCVSNNFGNAPNYPSSFVPVQYRKIVQENDKHEEWVGRVLAKMWDVTEEDFKQPGDLWNVLGRTPGQQENLVKNVAGHLSGARKEIRDRVYEMFGRVNPDLGSKIRKATDADVAAAGASVKA